MDEVKIPNMTDGNDRQEMLEELSYEIESLKEDYQPILSRDQQINKPFTELEQAVRDRVRESR